MNTAALTHTGSYIFAESLESHPPLRASDMSNGFITISKQSGSGGSSFARMLARHLNAEAPAGKTWTVLEGNLAARLLEECSMPAYLSRFLPEDKTPEPHAFIGEMIGLHPNIWNLLEKTNQAMREIARRGNVILVGRGANFATAEIPGGIHIRLVAPPEKRARYFAQLYDVTEEEARAINAKRDAATRRYVSANFNANIEDVRAYNLVLNTSQVQLAEAVGMVSGLLHKRQPI
ncbi:MAG: cytidylate kinase family protein [Nibricoccus sp.]